jgi:hypothetical protein
VGLVKKRNLSLLDYTLNNQICHLLRVSEPFMYRGSPNLPQTRKSSLKLNNTGDNGHIADVAQLAKPMGQVGKEGYAISLG